MPVRFHPKPGMVLMCDYSTGFVPPEMIKLRRSIVISTEEHNKYGLCTVVPISTTRPIPETLFHVRFEAGTYSFLADGRPCWAKCNMINTVSTARLDRIRLNGKYASPSISHLDLLKIYRAAFHVFGPYLDKARYEV